MLLVTLVIVYVLIQAGVATDSRRDQRIENNSSVELLMDNQCVTIEQVQHIVQAERQVHQANSVTKEQVQQVVQDTIQEAFQKERQVHQAELDSFYTRIQSTLPQYPNGSFQHPAASCKYLPQGSPSGHYWIQNTGTGYASLEFCDMARRCCGNTGGWMRVAHLDMTDPNHHCPSGFVTINSPRRTCGSRISSGCVSVMYPLHEVRYNRVCGRIKAYQHRTPDAFQRYYENQNADIDSFYVEGVSLTRGHSPRKHIWTFAAAVDETRSNQYVCPCTRPDLQYTGVVPPFIGQDYFCETGSRYHFQHNFYTADPLWDGQGCGSQSTCCSFNNPPWFCKQLPHSTTDDIELRLCAGAHTDEDVPIEIVEIFVQ